MTAIVDRNGQLQVRFSWDAILWEQQRAEPDTITFTREQTDAIRVELERVGTP